VERVLTNFIRALRSADVQVSTGESIDAAGAMKLMGYADRRALKDALGCVLAKSPDEKRTYSELFDLYFARRSPEAASEQETEGEGADGASDSAETHDKLEDLIASGDEAQIAMAMEQAGEDADVSDIRFSTQTAFYTQKMMKAMGGDKLQERLMQAFDQRSPEGEQLAEDLINARAEMQARAREYVKQQFEVFGAGATSQFREEILASKALSDLDLADLRRMKVLIDKMAKRLAVKHSRKRKRKNRGTLDVRKTLRANAGFDGVPFDVMWKQKKKDRPKIVAICDVSGSVAQYVRFLMLLLYGLNEAVPNLSAYCFSGRLEDVGETLTKGDFEPAMRHIVDTIGLSSTDYGQSLSDFKVNHWNDVDRRTTVIILGDGRSNFGDPRIDIFKEMSSRAKRVIWLSPEMKSMWGTGDSEMLRYAPYCNQVSHVATLLDLERAVDDVLAGYA